VSCLHDYSLSVDQMKAAENSQAVVISGAGLEDFMSDALASCPAVIDASQGIETTTGAEGVDPHIWMDPENAVKMVQNIAAGLAKLYPEDRDVFLKNARRLLQKAGRSRPVRAGPAQDAQKPRARDLPRRLRLLREGVRSHDRRRD
jgi:ABC-type Zn uptake system ZnuABC Zn-binding protein ZnuA